MKQLKRADVRAIAGICILSLFLVVMAGACGGKKEVKRESQESKTAQEAFAIAEALRAAYVQKDYSAIADKCTKEAYKEIIDSIRHFDSVELEFTPRWVEIDKTKVLLNESWKGTWVVGRDTVRERGMVVLQMDGRPLKLTKIVRGSPFRYPEK